MCHTDEVHDGGHPAPDRPGGAGDEPARADGHQHAEPPLKHGHGGAELSAGGVPGVHRTAAFQPPAGAATERNNAAVGQRRRKNLNPKSPFLVGNEFIF